MNSTAMASEPTPNPVRHKALWIGLAMILAAALAVALKPTQRLASQKETINLETLIPRQFAGWTIDETITPVIPDERIRKTLDKLYNQTLSRTYVNRDGQHMMLTIAYGANQSDMLQVHRPEVCYTAQGFQVLQQTKGAFTALSGETVPVKRLLATQGERIEPITYWITVGEKVSANTLERKLAQLKYGLTGRIPDGLLFRVSSISRDEPGAYAEQVNFIKALLAAMSAKDRSRLIGSPAA